MLLSQIPTKFPSIWGSGAGAGFITTPIPQTAQPNGRASLVTGFSTLNFNPLASGGIPPWGADFNGILYEITAWLQWAQAGGIPMKYDSTFASAVGGYPQFALLQSSDGTHYWLSQVDNNLVNPDSGASPNWQPFPDVIVQKQAGNYANDSGTAGTNYRVVYNPKPASLASIVGAPIRFMAAHANTINNPTMQIDNVAGDAPVTIINSNGTPLLTGQISRSGQICEGFFDGVFFQLLNPTPITAIGPQSPVVTGVVYEWSSEVVPSWGLECNGAIYNINAFPNLFNVTGNKFGGDGVNTFAVPDKRGAFTRGWDHGRGLDPSATTRTASPFGSPTVVGDHVGSWERASLQASLLTGVQMILQGLPYTNVLGGTSIHPIIQYPSGSDPGVSGAGSDPTNWGSDGFFLPGGTLAQPLQTLATGTQTGLATGTQESGVNPTFAPKCYAISGQAKFSGGSGVEVRPINIDMMYVIAF